MVRHSIFHNRSEVLAYNKRDQSYQNSCIFACYTSSFLPDVRTRVCEIDERILQNWRAFNSTLAFRKIHPRIRSPRMESLEIRTERAFVNTKHKVRQSPLFVRHNRAKYFLTRSLKMCSIILLKCKKLEGYNYVCF